MGETPECPESMSTMTSGLSCRKKIVEDWVFEAWRDFSAGASDTWLDGLEDVAHVCTVASVMKVLAKLRGLDPELAELIGLLHDAGRLRPGGALENHAEEGAREVEAFLKENGLVTASSRMLAVNAIRHHSSKKRQNEVYDELLKDADAFQRLIEGDAALVKNSWQRRALRVCHELECLLSKNSGQVLLLSPKDQSVQDGYNRFIKDAAAWLKLRRHCPMNEDSAHETRVFIRQIQALQYVFKPMLGKKRYRRCRIRLKAALHVFEAAREYSVERMALRRYKVNLDETVGNAVSSGWLESHSETMNRRFREGLSRAEAANWLEMLDAWRRDMKSADLNQAIAQRPLADFLEARICFLCQRWIKKYGSMDFLNDALIHRSRIEVKRLRYVLRAAKKLIRPEIGRLLEILEAYQTEAGDLHDAVVSLEIAAKVQPVPDKERSAEEDRYICCREAQGRECRRRLTEIHRHLAEEIQTLLAACSSVDRDMASD